ncbi:MAG: hypothetical protein E5X33_00155 [Mesorhizobium sp.]|uniref:hypothetical protein n=1 Tax=Mesorhizobium sp. TaxID=1871066 RepID=UPI000FE81FD7|nr:hypothetical protein [Mesorhizobium sp.]RWI85955.1 MAG: hypothetical protein EOR22_30285 [Mesorhizobium sp.]TIR24324.1 MAG: hypothetical protein E5X33_00155 [Mesorhizobium sp.]
MTGLDLTPPEHQHSAVIQQAVQWLLDTPRHERQGAAVPLLKARFGLSTGEAVAAVREFNVRWRAPHERS